MLLFVRRNLGSVVDRVRRAVRFRGWYGPDRPFRFLAGLRPDVILDVGANTGQSGARLRELGFLGRLVSFEPQPAAFAELAARVAKDPNWECHRVALGETPGPLAMHVSGYSESSSLLPIGKAHTDLMPDTAEVGVIEVPVVRLDGMAESLKLGGSRFALKLDVQGFELPALRGAGALLDRAVGAVVELNFAPLFDGQSKYHEVLNLLDTAGLRFLGLGNVNLHPATGDFLWADGLFARPPRDEAAHG